MRSRSLGITAGFLLVFLGSTVLVGCKSPAFVSKRYDNFTAYYNTFYNAKRSYRAGVTSRERRNEKIDRTQYIGVFIQQGPVGSGGQDFEDAVLKSADVLREHPESKWVDDALLLIGKSYFYESNFVGAQQKFQEAIDLDSDLEGESRFWLARTLSASGDYELAESAITEALAQDDGGGKWAASLRLVLGELRARQGDWESAADELAAGLTEIRDREVGARASFLLGQVLETLGRYEESVTAYRRTLDRRPDYELAYAAEYSAIRVGGQYVDAEAALRSLRRMERDDKHYSYRAELALLRADILRSLGDADAAYNVYDELLYDPVFAAEISQLRGRIHYSLGELYRDLDQDFVSAAAHFDTAAASLRLGAAVPGTTIDPLTLGPEAIRDGQELKEAFGAYASAFREVDRLDSLLWLGSMDDSTFAEKVLDLRRERARELEERQRQQEQRQIEQAFRQVSGTTALDNRGLPEGKIIPSRSVSGGESGFLFHDDPIMKQEGRLSFVRRWGDRPLVPNWRRVEAVTGTAVAEGREQEGVDEGDFALAEDQLPEVDISAVPRDSVSIARMLADRSMARYDVGTALFLGIGRPDSAAVWYRLALDDDQDALVTQRALYALAEIQQALGDSTAATGLYRRVLADYPDTEFADRIREILNLPPDQDAAVDSLASAETLYRRHYEAWENQEFHAAMNGMLETAGTYPTTAVLPQALLAAGSVFLEWADRDSLDVNASMPITVTDSVLVSAGLIAWPTPPDTSVMDTLDPSLVDSARVERPSGAADSATEGETPAAANSVGVPADSAAAAVAPPDSSVAVQVAVRPDSLIARAVPADSSTVVEPAEVGESEIEEVLPDEHWNEITLRTLLTTIRTRFGGTAYANAAGQVLSALDAIAAEEASRLDALRIAARTDSVAAGLIVSAADSLEGGLSGIPADSLGTLAAADSLALPAGPVRADSVMAASDTAAETDSLRSVEQEGGVPVKGSLATPVSADTVVAQINRPTPIGMAGARDRVKEADGELRVVESAEVQPLEVSEEEEGESWTGWTLVLSELDNLARAPQVRDTFASTLQEHGTPEIWTGKWEDGEGILIVIGRFGSQEETVQFAATLGRDLPLDAWLLHIMPAQ